MTNIIIITILSIINLIFIATTCYYHHKLSQVNEMIEEIINYMMLKQIEKGERDETN